MQLAEFIRMSLLGIAQGIREANAELERTEGEGFHFIMEPPMNRSPRPVVEFDVAVSASKSGGRQGAAGLEVAVVKASVGWGKGHSEQQTSRLQFKVEVMKPLV